MAYCTNTEVKTYLAVTGNSDDSLLTTLISAAQKQIDIFCHRTFEASADSTHYFDAVRHVDGRVLWLDDDLAAITSVTNGDGVAVSSAQYTTIPKNTTPYNRLRILGSSGKYWAWIDDPEDAIAIVGKWAYSTTAPADIKQACIRLAAFLYRQKDKQMFDVEVIDGGQYVTPLAIPNDVKATLIPYRKL